MPSRFLNLLIILALLMTGISPACKFISGQNSLVDIIICSGDGSKTIKVSESQSPFPQKQRHHQSRDDCAFCFAQAHSKLVKAVVPPLLPAKTDFITQAGIPHSGIFAERFERLSGRPRAPPLSIWA